MDDTAPAPEALDENTVNREDGGGQTCDGNATSHDAPACSASVADTSVAFEVIDGFRVHPAASIMPDMIDEQFTNLVESIAEHGLGEPIELKDDLLVEGRHRLRAIVKLRERGTAVQIRTAPWQPLPDETVAEYVKRKNCDRRHMTDSARLQCAAELLLMADKERAATGCANGRIQPGEVKNPNGLNQHSPREASLDGETDSTPPSDHRFRNKSKTERSAAGRLAKEEGQTIYKARQALAVQNLGRPDEIKAVKSGKKTQPQVLTDIAARTGKQAAKKKPKPIDHPFTPTTPLQHDLLPGWIRLRDSKAAINERQQARDDMRAFFNAEEGAEGGSKKSAAGKKKGTNK